MLNLVPEKSFFLIRTLSSSLYLKFERKFSSEAVGENYDAHDASFDEKARQEAWPEARTRQDQAPGGCRAHLEGRSGQASLDEEEGWEVVVTAARCSQV